MDEGVLMGSLAMFFFCNSLCLSRKTRLIVVVVVGPNAYAATDNSAYNLFTMSLAPVFSSFPLHHVSADSVVVQLPEGSGFGRFTQETLGGDNLAARLLKSFSTRHSVQGIVTRQRDAQGFRLLTVSVSEGWSGLCTYPPAVRSLVPQLIRKHILKGLGTTAAARVVRVAENGVIYQLLNGKEVALSVQQHSSAANQSDQNENDEEVEVRILNYDVEADVMNVTADADVVNGTPLDMEAASSALAGYRVGSEVKGTVLLSSTEDRCAVVAVGDPCMLGYYLYEWGGHGLPTVGAELDLVVEFAATDRSIQDVAPFLILSRRAETAVTYTLPAVRSDEATEGTPSREEAVAGFSGLYGQLLWRDGGRRRDRQAAAGETASDEDDDEGGHPEKVRRRRTEEALDAFERHLEEAVPSSPEDFERLLLASPHSSYLWTQFMAYYIKQQKLEDARQVAEKALQTIGVREEEEMLNVWVAYLNLENLYGTGESLSTLFKRALPRVPSELVLHERLADIFEASRKPHQLLSICQTMTTKWRDSTSTWERLGRVLIQQNKRDQLKRMLKDVGETLRKEKAALVVVHLAIHEFKHGSVESGRDMLERLLAKVPKKSDVWLAFMDQEIALLQRKAPEGSLLSVRGVFDRAAAMDFSAKVSQLIFTKYMNFEKSYGTAKDVERVRQLAKSYVDAKIQSIAQSSLPSS